LPGRGREFRGRRWWAEDANEIAILVVVCFLIGIARAWGLIGAPSIGIGQEITALFRDRKRRTEDSGGEQPSP
jgi:hypothetical protein